MTISLPVPAVATKTHAERTIEVRIPKTSELIKKNKILSAFFTILSAPVN